MFVVGYEIFEFWFYVRYKSVTVGKRGIGHEESSAINYLCGSTWSR